MKKTFISLLVTSFVFLQGAAGHFNLPATECPAFAAAMLKVNPPADSRFREIFFFPKGNFKIRKVVIDAGHGGKDGGCSGSYSLEKHINLSIALKLGQFISSQYPDVEIIYTRDTDVFIPLHERTRIANSNHADLFISIHCNYIPNSFGVKGTEVYVMGLHTAEANLAVAKRENAVILLEDDYEKNYGLDPNSPEGHILLSAYQDAHLKQSILLAEKIDRKVTNHTSLSSRSVLQAGFFVLRETTMPSVLIETGYLSNSSDEAFLSNESGQIEFAQAVTQAFGEYKTIIESGAAAPTESEPLAATPSKPVPANALPSPENHNPTVVKSSPRNAAEAIRPVELSGRTKKPEPVAKAVPVANTVAAAPAGQLQYRVQLAASRTNLSLAEAKWRNTGYLVEVVQEDGYFKYQTRSFDSFEAASAASKSLKTNGFPDAFIVAYLDGRKVTLAEAQKFKN
jgi:N-acetylmuramoyl-L-alanine amidase